MDRRHWRWLRQGRARLVLGCLALLALLALADLGQTGATAATEEQLEQLQAEHDQLARQDQQAHLRLGAAQIPTYVRQRAVALGLVLAPDAPLVIVVPAPTAQPVGGPP
jgi:hypothetical protein